MNGLIQYHPIIECPGCKTLARVYSRGICQRCWWGEKGKTWKLPYRMRQTWHKTDDRHEKYAELIKLSEEGFSAREIGAELGLTKNTVIGRLYRLGLGKDMYAGPSTMDRLQALHDRMDEFLAEYEERRSFYVLHEPQPVTFEPSRPFYRWRRGRFIDEMR